MANALCKPKRKAGLRLSACLLALIMAAGWLPQAAFAAGAHWADEAVAALNARYGDGFFTASDGAFTRDDAWSLAARLGYGDVSSLGGINGIPMDHIFPALSPAPPTPPAVTRAQACALVFALLGLPGMGGEYAELPFADCGDLHPLYKDAIARLHQLGAANGYSDALFAPDGEVSHAAFAVILYRALRAGIGIDANPLGLGLKPGGFGFNQALYFATRGGLPGVIEWAGVAGSNPATIPLPVWEGGTYTGAVDVTLTSSAAIYMVWTAHVDRLANRPPLVGPKEESGATTVAVADGNGEAYANTWLKTGDGTTLDFANMPAAAAIAELFGRGPKVDEEIGDEEYGGALGAVFKDVSPRDWFFEGVMYLFNNNIVAGTGDGYFAPERSLSRTELAVVLYRAKGNGWAAGGYTGPAIADAGEIPDWAKGTNDIYWALEKGIMLLDANGNFNPNGTVTRKEVIAASCALFEDFSAENVNLASLERFDDRDAIEEAYRPGIAYAVSIGIVGGAPNESGGIDVMPDTVADRATMGVILSRVLQGVDTSKMHDYETAVERLLADQ
ncbi:MAG: S-layer homology domain-containing protein [Clostridiales bacterium]|jgi:hypothetical protein|nr:S-layer homology domain-containing protein [Clostridiales bacterium]